MKVAKDLATRTEADIKLVKAVNHPLAPSVVGVMENTLKLVTDLANELEKMDVTTNTAKARLTRVEEELKEAEAILKMELDIVEQYLKPK